MQRQGRRGSSGTGAGGEGAGGGVVGDVTGGLGDGDGAHYLYLLCTLSQCVLSQCVIHQVTLPVLMGSRATVRPSCHRYMPVLAGPMHARSCMTSLARFHISTSIYTFSTRFVALKPYTPFDELQIDFSRHIRTCCVTLLHIWIRHMYMANTRLRCVAGDLFQLLTVIVNVHA